MANPPQAEFFKINWPEEFTSHRFVEGKPPPEENYITNDRMTWYRCELCGGFKLVKASPANDFGPEVRIIWKTVPYNMTSVCPHQS